MSTNPGVARWEVSEALTLRGLAADARAVTRGDIIPNDPLGEARYPRYLSRAQGAYVWDVDGNRYIDYLLGYGPVVLGHADPRVTAAATAELAQGNCIAPLWSPRQVELTELLNSIIPGAELALLLKTGSDATSAAVRLARIFTGRSKVVRWGYNGWHDWAAEKPAGIPPAIRADTMTFDLDPASLRAALERHPADVACVLTMPFEYEAIPPTLLPELRAVAHEYGALFVLDEMRSGFRMGLGGAQEYLSVQADLATFSKAIANGYALSAVTGPAEILSGLSETKVSSTFFANPVDMVAATTTISILRDTDAIDRLWANGRALQDGLRELVAEYGAPAEVVGYPPIPFLRFTLADPAELADVKLRFFAETTKRGVLFHPDHQWFVSAAHSAADIEETLEACRYAFEAACG
jgi:glutamate-1-semialdehyde aminotransferase